MLKGIPRVMSPDLMATLLRMGHGDEIVIADGNFPAESTNARVIRADGHSGAAIVAAIMKFLPLDTYADNAMVMQPVQKDVEKFPNGQPPIWTEYRAILEVEEGATKLVPIERFAFYERAKRAFAVVATGETAIYANLILKKGVITQE